MEPVATSHRLNPLLIINRSDEDRCDKHAVRLHRGAFLNLSGNISVH